MTCTLLFLNPDYFLNRSEQKLVKHEGGRGGGQLVVTTKPVHTT
jgi:hypothetical protein